MTCTGSVQVISRAGPSGSVQLAVYGAVSLAAAVGVRLAHPAQAADPALSAH